VKIGDKVLITTSDWFFAPDAQSYKAVWGTVKAIRTDSETLGLKTNARSTNWYVEIGNMLVAGCQVFYALKTDVMQFNEYIGMVSEGPQPCRVYNADCTAETKPIALLAGGSVKITKAEFQSIQDAQSSNRNLGNNAWVHSFVAQANVVLASRGIKGTAVNVTFRAGEIYAIDYTLEQ
jgi:hypothetical protein